MDHEQEMGRGSPMQHGGMEFEALELAPGETKAQAVTFDAPGQILYGCHEPGHYQGGMVGTVTVM